jgi:hypothetical protein
MRAGDNQASQEPRSGPPRVDLGVAVAFEAAGASAGESALLLTGTAWSAAVTCEMRDIPDLFCLGHVCLMRVAWRALLPVCVDA